MWRNIRQIIALTAGAVVAMFLVGTASAAAWGSGNGGRVHGPVVHTTTPSPHPSCPPRPPVTRPPVARPPVTRPPATRPPVTRWPATTTTTTTAPAGGHTAGRPPTKTPTTPTTTIPTSPPPTAAVAGPSLDTYDTFQAFVKGLEANAREEAARVAAVRAATARANARRNAPTAVPAPGALSAVVDQTPAGPPPDLFPHGPLFDDTPSPLLPLGDPGLRSARSFVLLIGLSAVALGFLAFRARLARRHAMFGSAVYDDRGDYVDFV